MEGVFERRYYVGVEAIKEGLEEKLYILNVYVPCDVCGKKKC